MPLYDYQCTDCEDTIELFQTYSQMQAIETQLRCAKCEGKMRKLFPVPHLATDTSFAAGWGDGFGDGESMHRIRAKKVAQAAGVSTQGKTYCPSLCAKGKPMSPEAWVPHSDAKGYIKKRCETLNVDCEDMGVKAREPENDPRGGSYRPAPDLVDKEVERIVEDKLEGHIEPKKRADLTEATAERLAGAYR